MSDTKCPFCQQELREIYCYNVAMGYLCPNPDCKKAEKLKGNTEFWQELIRTRKALDVAVDALKLFDSGQYTPQPDSYGLKTDASRLARKTLEQITALEQKDVK